MLYNGVDSVVLKVAGRCNINCTYCYMYNLVDKSYQQQPKLMSLAVVEKVFHRVEELFNSSSCNSFHISLHGGEPLLVGKSFVREVISLRDFYQTKTGKEISLSIQSNGLLLDDEWIEIFYSNKVQLGISLDGPEQYHDRFRLRFNGRGTHQETELKIKWLLNHPQGKEIFGFVLCVIHPDMNGKELLRYFHGLGLSGVDFIFPDQNYTYGSDCYLSPNKSCNYAKVLIEAYEEWRRLDDESFRVRKFEIIIKGLLGKTPTLDSLGNGPITVFTIETSGEMEPVDSLKCCGESFTKTGLHVNSSSILELNNYPLVKFGLEKARNLSELCEQCRFVKTCGGGYLPHRFKDGEFNNPTIYCSDMFALISYIEKDIMSVLSNIVKSDQLNINFSQTVQV